MAAAALKGEKLREKVFAALEAQGAPPYTVPRLIKANAIPVDVDRKEAAGYVSEWQKAKMGSTGVDLAAALEAARADMGVAAPMGGDQTPAAPETAAPAPAAPKATTKMTPPAPAKPKKAAATPKQAAAKAPPPAPAVSTAPQHSDVEADTPVELNETVPVPAMEPPVTAPAAPPAPDLAARIAELEAQNRELAASLKAAEGERDFLRGLVQTVVAGRAG